MFRENFQRIYPIPQDKCIFPIPYICSVGETHTHTVSGFSGTWDFSRSFRYQSTGLDRGPVCSTTDI